MNEAGPRTRSLLDRYRVTSGQGFRLDAAATDDAASAGIDKAMARRLLRSGVRRIAERQERLYETATWSLLVIFQAMDAAGKDSTIRHVLTGVNPQGVTVTSFRPPEPSERAHDFLWRVVRVLPSRGMIGVFNRSHYEEVVVTRVHEDLLDAEGLPAALRASETFWPDRIADIAAFEAYLGRQGTRVLKIFLNVGEAKQKQRLIRRLQDPAKTWKFDPNDVRERALWPRFRAAYEAAIAGTASPAAPWYVVPADRKWFARAVVAAAIAGTLDDLDLERPAPSRERLDSLAEARRTLEG